MPTFDFYANALTLLKPDLILVAAIIFAALWNLFCPRFKEWTPVVSMLALLWSMVELWQQFSLKSVSLLGGAFTVDKLTVAFGILVCLTGFIVVLMTMGYEQKFGRNQGEFYTILLTAILAVMLLAGATDLIMLFVALETLSLSCVLLSGMLKRDRKSNEAALKYLLSTAATTATLMYGLSFLYGITQSTNYQHIHVALMPMLQSPTLLVVFLLILVLSGIGFKLSMVPFHMWTPDVYEGAPTPVTAFLSIGSKAGGFVVAIRLLTYVFAGAIQDWSVIIGFLAILSMITGNLIALAQTSFKRMLAYSSIAHVGYILIGLASNTADGLSAMMFYLVVYGFMNLGAFAGAILFTNETGSDNINDYAGLITKRPWLAIGLSVCLLNLAGLPLPPAGFLAKIFIFWSGTEMSSYSGLGWMLVGAALITSVPAIYYYSRVVIKMVVREPSLKVKELPAGRAPQGDSQFYPIAALSFCVMIIILGSIWVTPLMGLSRDAVSPVTMPPALGCLPEDCR